MNFTVTQAHLKHLEDCTAALLNSKLGHEYFSADRARAALTDGITRGEVVVAVVETGECLGFVWVVPAGAFHSFPYVHIIAVKETVRGLGIGTQLLGFVEETVFATSSKVFLVVADFNPDAKRLYERLGYRQVGQIPGLYKAGVTEYLMMKERAPLPNAAW